jgi:hypothetical protein
VVGSGGEDADLDVQLGELLGGDRGEAAVFVAGGDGEGGDLLGEGATGGGEVADAAPQLAVLAEGDEHAPGLPVGVGELRRGVATRVGLEGVAGDGEERVHGASTGKMASQ